MPDFPPLSNNWMIDVFRHIYGSRAPKYIASAKYIRSQVAEEIVKEEDELYALMLKIGPLDVEVMTEILYAYMKVLSEAGVDFTPARALMYENGITL